MARKINEVIRNLQKSYGENTFLKGSEILLKIRPTGIPTLDIDLGGGLPMGRINILAGQEGSGKTSLAMIDAANIQKMGIPIFWFDSEKAFDPQRAAIFSLDAENMTVIRYLNAESTFAAIRDLIREMGDDPVHIVFDSLASNTIEKLFEDDASKQFGGSARVNNQSLTVWNTLLKPNHSLLVINELRDKMNSMGEPDMMPGGRGQSFIASTIIWLRPGETIKDGQIAIGQQVKWTIKKSRTSAPKERGQVDFYYAKGFEVVSNLILAAVEKGIIEQGGGGWYTFPRMELRIRSKEALVEKIASDPEVMKQIKAELYSQMQYPMWTVDTDKLEVV